MSLAAAWKTEYITLGVCRVCDTVKVLPPFGPRLTEECRVCGQRRDFDQVVYDEATNQLTRVIR